MGENGSFLMKTILKARKRSNLVMTSGFIEKCMFQGFLIAVCRRWESQYEGTKGFLVQGYMQWLKKLVDLLA